MISSFKYLSPVQEAYSKVIEAENAETTMTTAPSAATISQSTSQINSQTKELLDSKKGNPYRMSDEDRKLFYQGEIKRLKRLEKYFEQQRKTSMRNVAPQGYANAAIRNTIEKYQRELEKMNQNQNIKQPSPSPSPSTTPQQSF